MQNEQLIVQMVAAISGLVPRAIPVEIDCWDAETIGTVIKKTGRHVVQRYACLPDFPAPVRLSIGSNRTRSGAPGRAEWQIRWHD